MASIRKRGNKYQAQVRLTDSNPISKTFDKKSDALIWARMIESKVDKNDLPVNIRDLKNIKLSDIIIRYRDEISIKKLSFNSEVYILNAFLRQSLAKYPLSIIKTSDFSEYRERRLKTVKIGTVQRELTILKHALDVARIDWGIPITTNPIKDLKRFKVNNARDRRLWPDEYKLLVSGSDSCRNPHILSIINFALETAMRRGEILAIEWDDINFQKRTLHIPITKNGHARIIPLSAKAIDILKAKHNYERPFPITADSIKKAWQRLIKRSGVSDLHFHDLRHEAISRFFERSLSIPEVALISGHRDYRMLFRYTHLKAEDIVRKL